MKTIKVKGPILSNEYRRLYRDWLNWDMACPNDIEEGLAEADGDDVTIEINSPGGVCVCGYEMYNTIKNYGGHVTAHVVNACSAATLIACAADETLMADAGIFMIHNSQSAAEGDYRDMQMEAEALKAFNEGIINAYVKKTGKCREELQSLMDNDTYMSPQKAIELGFADGYINGGPNERLKTDDGENMFVQQVAASTVPVIPPDKLKAITQALAKLEEGKNENEISAVMQGFIEDGMTTENHIENVVSTDNVSGNSEMLSEKNIIQKEEKQMTLEEFLRENPEASAEIDTIKASAREEGVQAERARMQSLDAISASVSPEALNDAKYNNPTDGQTLAYNSLVNGNKLATAYMQQAMADTKDSGVENVAVGAGEDVTADEADEMASYVNIKRGR